MVETYTGRMLVTPVKLATLEGLLLFIYILETVQDVF
jgi:hypothetical protein